MTEKQFEVTNISKNGNTGLFWFGKDNLSVYDIVRLLNELFDENKELTEENEQLKAQLYCDSEEGVCSICKHHYLEKGNIFYISKCEKGHEKCSKESVRHCEDFKLKECKND